MSDIENTMQNTFRYVNQRYNEKTANKLFHDFGSDLEEFNKNLDLLIRYKEKIPQGSEFYRARTIGVLTYNDLYDCKEEDSELSLFGFAPEKMLAPPTEKATSGRANQVGESFLYLSNKPEVCCAEVRPIFTEMISVIKFTLRNEINVINFKTCEIKGVDDLEIEMLKKVMLAMTEPVKEQTDESYKITQHIVSYYRSKGFDGIKYGTLNSCDRDSFNLVIFDEKNVTWNEDQKSEVYRVISKSMTFQNITNKREVIEVKNGNEKLEKEYVDQIIRNIKLVKIINTKQ